jgi:hypothetical protein
VGAKGSAEERPLDVAPLRLSKTEASPGDKVVIMTAIFGGHAPYKYGITIGDGEPQPDSSTDNTGWIATELPIPDVANDQALVVHLLVKDANNHSVARTDKIIVHTKHPPDAGAK